jgi:hypothetical protein
MGATQHKQLFNGLPFLSTIIFFFLTGCSSLSWNQQSECDAFETYSQTWIACKQYEEQVRQRQMSAIYNAALILRGDDDSNQHRYYPTRCTTRTNPMTGNQDTRCY